DLRTHVAKGGTLPASVVSDLEDGLDAAARGITTALASLGR
ncbi:PadR family transcriptional regulator, partial [Pseudomonas sp. BGM005]|nr:PadR family transcriptional regulator [Pseudomonas sp. BG5]